MSHGKVWEPTLLILEKNVYSKIKILKLFAVKFQIPLKKKKKKKKNSSLFKYTKIIQFKIIKIRWK